MRSAILSALFLLLALSPTAAQRKRQQHSGVIAAPPPPELLNYANQSAAFSGNKDKWVHDHIHYPQEAREQGWTGTVLVMFEVLQDGSVHFLSVKKSSGYLVLDNEARRLISAMPRWKPAKVNGRAIPYLMTIPIVFKIRE